MTFAPPLSQPTPGLESLALPWSLRLSPEQFKQVCKANPDAMLELAADGQLIAMTPPASKPVSATASC
jgi:Uma2 family endonuclease